MFPDPAALSPTELKAVIKCLIAEEARVSERRRVLHDQIDADRRELVNRLREGGELVIEGSDIDGGSCPSTPGRLKDISGRRQASPGVP